MKTFKHLEISNSSFQKYIDLLNTIKNNLGNGWSFDEEALKGYLKMAMLEKEQVICLRSPRIMNREALLWFGVLENKLEVYNIVPTEVGSLSYEEYNSILDRFYKDCLAKNITDPTFSIKYTSDTLNIENIISEETYKLLRSWEAGCNKTTGNTHPMDFQRWAAFIISAYKEQSAISSNFLERWLLEEKGWVNEELVNRLIIDFEYSMDLLEYYDQHR